MVLEVCAAVLVALQLLLTWYALDDLPATVVPYFSPASASGMLPGAGIEARLWVWMVLGLWAMFFGTSLWLYRTTGSSPIPILSVGAFALLAVLRAGVIALNLNPALTPAKVLFRSLVAGLVVMLLGIMLERWRTKKRLVPALMRPALYDEPTPRGPYYFVLVLLGMGLPWLLFPRRIKVLAEGVVAITPTTYLWIPAPALTRIEEAGLLQAIVGSGLNLATSPGKAVRLWRRRRWIPLVLSVVDRPRFMGVIRKIGDI